MPLLVAAALVVAVHLATALGAWTGVGFLADDHEMVGVAVLRHREQLSFLSMFVPPDAPPVESARALYRPFVDLLFWLEQPWFGVDAFGYHVTNSVLHCGTALLWFVLVRRLSGSALAGLATAVLFAGWPGHSEATHWIAARTNVLSTFLLSASLAVHQRGLDAVGRAGRAGGLGLAALLAAAAVGSKESAVFVVPLAALLSWLATSGTWRARVRGAAATALPLVVAVIAWLAWRASCLGTWGTGSGYGWKVARIGAASCSDWALVLLAPAHAIHVPAVLFWLLAATSVLLLVLGLAGARRAPGAALLGGALLACGYVAGIGLEALHRPTLENVRYSYEPALGLCVVFGLGLALLTRQRAFVIVLGGVVVLHAGVLHQNRQPWLRVSANYDRLRADVLDLARAMQQPIRVLDAPGVYEGAFGLLNGFTEFLFMQGTAPPGVALQGKVSSTVEWPAVLFELAAAARARQQPANTFVAQWHDGSLTPFTIDAQWPRAPWPGVEIGYARVARERPFAGTDVPVHVLVEAHRAVWLAVEASVGGGTWSSHGMQVVAAMTPTPVVLSLTLPATLAPDVPVDVRLSVRPADGDGVERTFPLAPVVPAAR